MNIRKTTAGEIPAVMSLYAEGRQYMRANGNMEQWSDGYPSRSVIEKDIEDGVSYVVEEANEIIGVFAFMEGPDRTYLKIYDGDWGNDAPYHVIHRIVSKVHSKGVAAFVYRWAFDRCSQIRIDTHRDNIPMQNSLKKNGFTYKGIIYLESGDERLAFLKIKGE